jgi:hypothetical protein
MRNRKGTYTLTSEPRNAKDEESAKLAGMSQDFDSTPYYFTTDDRSEIMNMTDVLEEYEYTSAWTMTKKEKR